MPTALRLVKTGGKPRGRYVERAKREPVPPPGLPGCPDHFTAGQRAIWERLVADSPDGLLTRVDAGLFEAYVVLLDARNEATRKFNEGGCQVLTRGAGGMMVTNPYLREIKRLCESLRPITNELGYSPASRTRISVPVKGQTGDLMERFLGGARGSAKPKAPSPRVTKSSTERKE